MWPVAPTPFHDDGNLDLTGMRRVLDCMIDRGVDGICILANFSEQFQLGDEERAILTRLCLEHVAGRKPVIVTVSHFSTAVFAHLEGRRDEAKAIYANLLPVINFENRQGGWRACKTVMKEGGVIASDHVRHPTRPLHPDTRAQLLELVRETDPLALRWAR